MTESPAPPAAAAKSTEDELFEAMDRQALRFIAMLEDETKDAEGNDKIDIQLKMKVFQMGQDWLVRRKKLRPDSEDGSEGAGVTEMREWINNPSGRKDLEQLIFSMGFIKAPAKKNGRPTKAEAVVRQRFAEYTEGEKERVAKDDDSGLQALLGRKGDKS